MESASITTSNRSLMNCVFTDMGWEPVVCSFKVRAVRQTRFVSERFGCGQKPFIKKEELIQVFRVLRKIELCIKRESPVFIQPYEGTILTKVLQANFLSLTLVYLFLRFESIRAVENVGQIDKHWCFRLMHIMLISYSTKHNINFPFDVPRMTAGNSLKLVSTPTDFNKALIVGRERRIQCSETGQMSFVTWS